MHADGWQAATQSVTCHTLQTEKSIRDTQVFRDRWNPRPHQQRFHDRGDGDGGRPGGRRALSAGHAQAQGGDWQGHPPFGLHDGKRARRRLHQRGHGRGAGRTDADPGGGDAHPLDARGPWRDDLRQPQPVPGQRHQAVRPRWLQAFGRGRAAHRGVAGRRRPQAGRVRGHRPCPPDRGCARALYPCGQGIAA